MQAEFVERARRIGERLLAEAREGEEGSLTWGRGADGRHAPVPDSGPYSGRCGEALLLAALRVATGESRFEEAALRVLLGLRRGLDVEPLQDGLVGVGGCLYALVRVGHWLGREELLESARRLADVFTPERMARDTSFDVIHGAAGALLALLALEETGAAEALPRAERYAAHLLAHRTADPTTGLRAWATLRAEPSTGFAHGASGIAHALLRLHQRTGTSAYYEAALEAFAFERALFREPLRNWDDSRVEPPGAPRMWSWCHGAPGLALGRLTALPCLREGDESDVVGDLKRALQATVLVQLPNVDPVCCGHFGRIDILLEASRRLDNPSLERQARQLAQARLRYADEHGFVPTPAPVLPPHLEPGFWQGQAGIGYTLLRLADAERFPCVLAMG